ncbi:hypothetical protein CH289_11915 [Rhodococcus sp. RS1C4]|uniref:hypothetical protein n=1 Tax=Rhodococcus sp. 114MFTsu3.1 TaxID=1172184 RepID=UPI000372D217|nr:MULTISPECIES: hypothetical protein [unclassified Rhodococcus (in: high G+C Gram-positive bacteria)]OZC52979.1 hypothetical protein CH289_11915 [Rhodococcus sp. RS1C4]
MGSLEDSSDIGAKPIGDQRFYDGKRAGTGRWATLNGLGVLRTDDKNALQLASTKATTDNDAANATRYRLIDACRRGIAATTAIDTLVAKHGNPPVTTGDLGGWSDQVAP